MKPYGKWAPTKFDRQGAFLDDRQDWLVLPVLRTRDSGTLDESNYETAEKMLSEADPDGDTWENHRFNHWNPGWFDILIVKPNTDAHRVGEEIEKRLEGYPILDEEDHSEREYKAACKAWKYTHRLERIAICARHKVSIFAARRNEIPQNLPYYDDFYRPE